MTPPRRRSRTTPIRLVVIELATTELVARHWQDHLCHGGAFGPPGGKLQANVSLLIVGPAATPIEVLAKTVYCGPEGTGYELIGFGAALREQVETWVAANTAADAAEWAPTIRAPRVPAPLPARPVKPAPEPALVPIYPARPAPESGPPPALVVPVDEPDDRIPLTVFERLRALTAAQQLRLARDGELNERVALERMLGKVVWDGLLRNPKVTPREVARIARMGSVPVPMLELIVGNGAWVRAPEVRRALLINPRLGGDLISRVLRLLPKHELRLVPLQTAYPPPVREAARKMLP